MTYESPISPEFVPLEPHPARDEGAPIADAALSLVEREAVRHRQALVRDEAIGDAVEGEHVRNTVSSCADTDRSCATWTDRVTQLLHRGVHWSTIRGIRAKLRTAGPLVLSESCLVLRRCHLPGNGGGEKFCHQVAKLGVPLFAPFCPLICRSTSLPSHQVSKLETSKFALWQPFGPLSSAQT